LPLYRLGYRCLKPGGRTGMHEEAGREIMTILKNGQVTHQAELQNWAVRQGMILKVWTDMSDWNLLIRRATAKNCAILMPPGAVGEENLTGWQAVENKTAEMPWLETTLYWKSQAEKPILESIQKAAMACVL